MQPKLILFDVGMRFSFLLLLYKITTNLVAYNNRSILSYSSGSPKSKNGSPWAKIKVRQEGVSAEGCRGESISQPFPAPEATHTP